MKQQFNMDEALELIKQGARIDGKEGVYSFNDYRLLTQNYERSLINITDLNQTVAYFC